MKTDPKQIETDYDNICTAIKAVYGGKIQMLSGLFNFTALLTEMKAFHNFSSTNMKK